MLDGVLTLLKNDLGIRNDSKDSFFRARIEAARQELQDKGIQIDLTNAEDMVFLSDWTAWRYRKRMDDSPALPEHLRYQLYNRQVKGRARHAE